MDDLDQMLASGFDPAAQLVPVDIDGDDTPEWQTLADDSRIEVHDVEPGRFVAVDSDRDGDWEAIGHDQDGDSTVDLVMRDRDGDGVLEDVSLLPPRLSFGTGETE
jgi:hypothetical protein